ncbi:MAG: DUF1552 domain-containing protein [Gammaproteobacteria bacterium]|nr:DUF1552 domain-containing protein [Gammaproteobacteria bacterium]
MFVTKKYLSRRAVLRGLGATVALPLLDAMVPAATAIAKTAAAPKSRLGFIYFPHGAIMNNTIFGPEINGWEPDIEGRDFDLKPILAPLKPFQDRLTVLSNIDNDPARSSSVHAITPGTWLSCVRPAKSATPDGSITIDQIAGKHIGQDTPFPTLEVAVERGWADGSCDGAYGCAFGNTLCFADGKTPLPMEYDAHKLFSRLFGGGETPEERELIAADRASLLDFVADDAQRMRKTLGAADRAVLDDYLQNVREIERRAMLMSETNAVSASELPDMPAGVPDVDGQIRLMFDLIALAYQADLTRVASFMMAAEVSVQTYPHIGVPEAFHPLSHQQRDRPSVEKLAIVNRYFTEVFADFLKRMDSIPAGDSGSMLDASILMYGSNMTNGNHDNYPLPITLLGGGNGTLKGNQHLRMAPRTPHANILLSIMRKSGVPMESVGDSTGEITEL